MKFTELGLSKPVTDALAAKGYETPTPIQAQAIPALL
ncbi:MAG: DEAD/DEAH box helicase, partial [Sphingomonadales bacterium]|nr:DEAD/DEAH box helicase [Sphingomonadales bacterium]